MEDIISKQGSIKASEETVFIFLSDLRNLDSLIPADKVQDWKSTEDTCSFSVPQAGEIELKITEKEPNNMIKVEPEGKTPIGFAFYIQLKEINPEDTRIKLTFRAEMNLMIKSMISGPIKKSLDQIVDTIGDININPANQ